MRRRRSLLLGTLAGTSAWLTSQTARAFSIEVVPDNTPVGLMLQNRCNANVSPDHARIMTGLEAELAGRQAAPGTVLTAEQVCPMCGCPVIARRRVS